MNEWERVKTFCFHTSPEGSKQLSFEIQLVFYHGKAEELPVSLEACSYFQLLWEYEA